MKSNFIVFTILFCFLIIACNSKSTSTTESAQGNLKSNDSSVSFSMEQKDDTDKSDLSEPVGKIKPLIDDENHRAVAMLNYLTVQVQKILDTKENKVAIEQIYNEILNNTSPNAVDKNTQSQLNTILDTINKFRLIDTDREHLQILFENDQAQSLSSAMPEPTYLLSSVISGNPLKTIASVAMTGLSSWTNYNNSQNNAKLANLKAEWELDEKEQNEIHDLRKGTFNYLIEMVHDFEIPDEYTLNEESVKNFVKYSNEKNSTNRKIKLQGVEDTYSRYGPYWGLLAKTYYELSEYKNCLEAIKNYEIVRAKIFRYDYDFAMVLPYAILSLEKVYGKDAKYFSEMERYLSLLEKETPKDKWQMRYFIAQSYVSLAGQSDGNKNKYLEKALEISKFDLVTLGTIQEEWIDNYLKPVDETIADNLTKSEVAKRKEQISREKQRKATELIPYHEGLLNAHLLYVDLANQTNVAIEKLYEAIAASLKPLSIYYERYYLITRNFDDSEHKKLLEPYNLDYIDYENTYNIYDFRLAYDDKQMDYTFDDHKTLVDSIVKENDNNYYYLPSLYHSTCYYEKPIFGNNFIDVDIPLCLLRENTQISYRILEADSRGGEYETIYYMENVPYQVNVWDYTPDHYTALYDTPIYFKYCNVKIDCDEKIKIDNKRSYVVVIGLNDNQIFSELMYKDFALKSEKKNNLSNFIGIVD